MPKITESDFFYYFIKVRDKMFEGYHVVWEESADIFYSGDVFSEFYEDEESFEFLEPELMAFALLVGDNLRMTLERLFLDAY